MEIVALVLSSLSLILVVAMFIFLIVWKKNSTTNNGLSETSEREIRDLATKLELLNSSLPKDIDLSIKNEMIKMLDSQKKDVDASNDRLIKFQTSINDTVEKKFQSLNESVSKNLVEINNKVNEKLEGGFKDTNKTFVDVRERLAKIDEAQKNIEKLSGDVVSLQSILQGNQTRGRFGEVQLRIVLNNVFDSVPNAFAEQYNIRPNAPEDKAVRPDAVVFLPPPQNMICIDSKFPFADFKDLLESREEDPKKIKEFGAAVKKHIKDIKEKYIIKGKTATEAFMFIPSDGVFAFIHNELPELVDEARNDHVLLTSPSTLQPILGTIAMVQINYARSQKLNVISEELKKLSSDFAKFEHDWNQFSVSLDRATKNKSEFDHRVDIINRKFDRIEKNDILEIDEKEDKDEGGDE